MDTFSVLLAAVLIFILGITIGGAVGSVTPSQETVQKIEQSVYEKELGTKIGAMKYKCNLVGGEFVTQSGKSACIINGSEL